ncbi:MAG: T9SS type A sorting domain-containing protein [Syntrophothermus sp.]
MKKMFILLAFIVSVSVHAQNYYYQYSINFEDTSQLFRLQIDTLSNPANIWQIGPPQKTIFNAARSVPNVIITDTVNAYPVNDTSRFVIKHVSDPMGGFQMPHTVTMAGYYKVDCDSLTDFGTIEFSPDNGTTWVDLFTDTTYLNQNCYEWLSNKPVLTGNTSQWTWFYVWVAGFGPVFNIQPGDTVLYRFTFFSDSIQTNKEGLMYDDLDFLDYAEGVNELQSQFYSKATPNPASGTSTIRFDNNAGDMHELILFDNTGSSILLKQKTDKDHLEIEMNNYPSGIYLYKLQNQRTGKLSFGKIVKKG